MDTLHQQSTLGARLTRLTGSSADWQPLVYRLSEEAGRRGLDLLLEREAPRLHVSDTILSQIGDLIKSRQPSHTFTPVELDSLTREHLGGAPVDEYGAWVYYPWSRRLVHLLDAADFAELRTNRNLYKITPAEQTELATKRIGIVGLSVGQSVAAVLALERSFGEMRLADFDTLDLSNLNRIRAGVHALGDLKAYACAREIAELDPYLKLSLFPQGISAENVEAFLLDGGKLDVVIEECDSLDIKLLVRHHARAHRIPVVMDTSDRGMLDIERYDLEPDRPFFHGLAGDLRPESVSGLTAEQKIPYVLQILGLQTTSSRLRSSLLEVGATLSTWPQLGSAVSMGGAAAADAARRILLGQPAPSGRSFFDLEIVLQPKIAETHAFKPAPRQSPVAPPDSVWRKLVAQAILAPSGGNSQPWRWLAAGDELRLLLDTGRAETLIDFESSGALVALGCAAENLVLAAHAAGLEIELRMFPPGGGPEHVASFSLLSAPRAAAEPHWRDELHAQIPLRHTHRGLGRRRTLTEADLESLTGAVRSVAGASVQWLTEERDLDAVGQLIGAGDRLRILSPRMHREMFSEIRWSSEEAESSRDGIAIDSLELTPSDRAGLELCRDWSTLALVHELRGGRNLEKMSRKQVAAAAAVGLIALPGATPADYFRGGRALERMWLAASERNIAVHPMTSLPYLFARLIRGEGAGLEPHAAGELRSLRAKYERLFQLTSTGAEVVLFRVGFCDTTPKLSVRRSVDDVLTTCRVTCQ